MYDDEERAARRRERDRIRNRFPDFNLPGFECDPGWYGILESLFEEVEEIIPAGQRRLLTVGQIKEKFGGLRVYMGYGLREPKTPDALEIQRRIAVADFRAECRAARTCEVCGNRGVLREGGWWRTTCDLHADGRKPPAKARGRSRERPRIERWSGEGDVFEVYEYDPETDTVTRLPDKTRQD